MTFVVVFVFVCECRLVTSLHLRRCQLRQRVLFQHASEVVHVQLVRERAPVPVPSSGRGGACALVAYSDARFRVQLRRPEHLSVSHTNSPFRHLQHKS